MGLQPDVSKKFKIQFLLISANEIRDTPDTFLYLTYVCNIRGFEESVPRIRWGQRWSFNATSLYTLTLLTASRTVISKTEHAYEFLITFFIDCLLTETRKKQNIYCFAGCLGFPKKKTFYDLVIIAVLTNINCSVELVFHQT